MSNLQNREIADPLIELVQKRIVEIEAEILKFKREGAYASVRRYEASRNDNIEILSKLNQGKKFMEEICLS